jgi:hypothetical protein
MIFKPWEKQEIALKSDKPIIIMAFGIQGGKTVTGALKLKMLMHKYTDPTDNFIITAPTYKILNQSTLPAFLNFMRGLGTYNHQMAEFTMNGGGKCFARTGTDPNSVVGITNVRGILCDEIGLYSLYFWENILARAAFKNAQIIGVTSPYTLNWLYKDIIRPKSKNKEARPDVELIQARSNENPYFPQETWDRNKANMEERRFNMMFGGEWNKAEGLVYDCFCEIENICDPFILPKGTKFYGGVDWGTTAPFALLCRAVTPEGRHYNVAEFYKTGLTITDMILAAGQMKLTWGIERFYCDPSQPGYIEEFNRAGLTALGANNDIRLGIDLQYELIKTRKYQLFRGKCPYTEDEMASYHWPSPEELGPDKHDKPEKPVKHNDHAMDADRMLTVSLFRSNVKRTIKTPKDHLKFDQLPLCKRPDFNKQSKITVHSEKF